ncbi:hypothetical protein TRIUR3_35440 [Triticum urartu]|uniref:Uncharacterized protein n=1 Tax=Triticum urartu TaxID=4572 RepID=M8A360_TRIUA|nr:hypothetical protein TRIUR3_35440 [Triticum urartu]
MAVLHSSRCSFGEESWQRGRGCRATRLRAGTVASMAVVRVRWRGALRWGLRRGGGTQSGELGAPVA